MGIGEYYVCCCCLYQFQIFCPILFFVLIILVWMVFVVTVDLGWEYGVCYCCPSLIKSNLP